ncbi:glycosyltransferase family 4 protein [Flavobacteriaceae sp. LMIT009]
MERKIAVICDYKLLPSRVGGMDYFYWEFDKKCKANNIQVDWFFPNINDHGEYQQLEIFHPKNNQSLTAFVLKRLQHSEKKYTHVITHFVELCTSFFCDLKKMTKAQIITVDHNPRPLKGYPIKKRIKKRLKGWLYSKCIDHFIGVSQYTVNQILKDFGSSLSNKVSVIYNGVIINDIHVQTKRKTKIPGFLVASHLRESKGIQDLIEAVNLLPESIKTNLQIDIYGEGPYRERLIDKVKKKNLEQVFQFKGSVSNLNEVYCKYDYLLLPSHMECFSLAILESLAANVPVIASNIGGNEEAITHDQNGYVFRAQNINELSQLIEEVYIGNKRITINTRTEIEKQYSLDKMVNEHYKLLK